MSTETAAKIKMFVRPLLTIALTLVVIQQEIWADGVSGEMLTMFSMVLAFYFGEAAGARMPGQGGQD